MASNFVRTTIGELCREGGGNVQTGPFGSQLKASAYKPVGVPTIMPADLVNYRVDDFRIARIGPEDHSRLARHQLRPGDIVYGRRGDIGRHALISAREQGWLCGTGCLRIRLGKSPAEPQFVSYYLRQPKVIDYILGNAVGTTMPNLNTAILEAVPILLPPLAEQRAIAHILGSLDDKIELNRQMNGTLEEMARAIFKSWFVDFDPVHAKARGEQPAGMDAATAALFPDSFEETELGPVPSGWRIGDIGAIADNRRRNASPDEVAVDTPYIGLEHMPQRSIALSNWGRSDTVTSGKSHFEKGEILFGKLRPYFHKVGVAPITGICSTDIVVVKEKALKWFGLLLGHLSSTAFVDYTNAVSSGTKMPRTNWSDMARYQVLIPSDALAARLTEITHPLIALIHHNVFESRTLAELRDTLLPKLMSGELRVPEAAEMVS